MAGTVEQGKAETNSRVFTIMLCIFLLALVLASALYAILARDTEVLPFLVSFCVVCGLVAAFRLYTVNKIDSKLEDKRKELAKVAPSGCPDYWTSVFDCSSGVMKCQGYFDSDDGRVYMSDLNEDVMPSKTDENICSSGVVNRQVPNGYPWMEVRKACDVRTNM